MVKKGRFWVIIRVVKNRQFGVVKEPVLGGYYGG